MCFGSPKMPESTPAPQTSPPPTVLPTSVSEVSAQETARKQKVAQLRYGFASTIKTSPQGLLQPGTDNTLKKTLG